MRDGACCSSVFRADDPSLPPELGQVHDDIIKAIELQDADRAEQLAHDHANEVHRRFVDYVSRRSMVDFQVML